ncbi:PIN domain protein [uncultured archaeon]|nr:PIN domain protein [uncultured archaeon]
MQKKSGQKKAYLIDTNIFLELLLNRAFKNDCARLLKEVEIGNLEVYVSSFSIHSIEVILSNFNKEKELKIFLGSIIDFEGLFVYTTNLEEELEAIEETENGLDFDDALQSFVTKRLKASIISYDKHFDKIKGLKRLTPSDILKTLD